MSFSPIIFDSRLGNNYTERKTYEEARSQGFKNVISIIIPAGSKQYEAKNISGIYLNPNKIITEVEQIYPVYATDGNSLYAQEVPNPEDREYYPEPWYTLEVKFWDETTFKNASGPFLEFQHFDEDHETTYGMNGPSKNAIYYKNADIRVEMIISPSSQTIENKKKI
jgi:hypothetical protein